MNRIAKVPNHRISLLLLLAVTSLSSLAGETPSTSSTHWAFQPRHRPALPTLQHASLARTPIDHFILQRLEQEHLELSGESDRFTLLRRVAFTLTGLPPTEEEIKKFTADTQPGGYRRMIDWYLASRHYGERWGKHWLDAAGYADSNGYFSADTDRPLAYRYRDYVIRSLNRNKPFDAFVREQLAGDELSGWRPGQAPTPEIIELLEATHFLRNGQDGSGESDGNPDEVRADRYYALESTMQIIGSSLLGLTIQCAKCHDHKFEPFTQKDYFAFQASLYPAFPIENWIKPNDRVVQASLPGELEAWEAKENRLKAEQKALQEEFNRWVAAHRPRGQILFQDTFDQPITGRWSNIAPDDDTPGGTPAVALDAAAPPAAQATDGTLRILESGGPGDRWVSTVQSFPWQPPAEGGWIQVTFDLTAMRLGNQGPPAQRIGYFIALHDFNDNSPVPGGNILVDGNPGGATSVHVDYPGADDSSRGNIGSTGYHPGHNYGVRVTRTGPDKFLLEHLVDGATDGASLELKAADLPPGGFGFEYCCGRSFIVDNIVVETSALDAPGWAERQTAFRSALTNRQQTFQQQKTALASQRTPKPGRIAWVTDVSAEAPPVRLLTRGNPRTPGELVQPAFPVFLGRHGKSKQSPVALPAAGTTGRRLAWARWITDPASPQAALLARVTVNRIWHHYFGAGLVTTTDNLGASGAPPTHPQLLDWLAAEFIESGWDLKSLHRLLLQSAVFRQKSAPRPGALAQDPSDQLLWRFPLRRLDAEAIRDAMIAATGRLHPMTEGPYVPTSRTPSGEVVVEETRPNALARSVFLQQRRTQVATFLGVFDAPSIVFNCTRRAETTMPLQSLSLLNSDFAVHRARDLAQRLDEERGYDSSGKLRLAFLLTSGREPDTIEEAASRRFLQEQRRLYSGNPDAERSAWVDFCQTLFGLNSFLYLE